MDEKEQADRMAAAEALFMISNKNRIPPQPFRYPPKARRKISPDPDEIAESSVDTNSGPSLRSSADSEMIKLKNESANKSPPKRGRGKGRGARGTRGKGGDSRRGGKKGRGRSKNSNADLEFNEKGNRSTDIELEENYTESKPKLENENARSTSHTHLSNTSAAVEEVKTVSVSPKKKKKTDSSCSKDHNSAADVPEYKKRKTEAILGFTGAAIPVSKSTPKEIIVYPENIPSVSISSGIKKVIIIKF